MPSSQHPPPALKHGLTSRAARAAWSESVAQLAEALLGASPPAPEVVAAARELAEAILYERLIQHRRLEMLEAGALARAAPTEAERAPALELSRAVKAAPAAQCAALRNELQAAHDPGWAVDVALGAEIALHQAMTAHAAELRRLADYERRAHARRREHLRRLDYARIEAERHLVGGG